MSKHDITCVLPYVTVWYVHNMFGGKVFYSIYSVLEKTGMMQS